MRAGRRGDLGVAGAVRAARGPAGRVAVALAAALLVIPLSSCGSLYPPQQPYEITLQFVTWPTSAERLAFEAASAHWSRIIVADLPDVWSVIPARSCVLNTGSGTIYLPEQDIRGIDDLRIDVWIGAIDGPDGILGMGGPCYFRDAGGLPVYGVMALDAADAGGEAYDALQTTVLHEMGHVLGIGAPDATTIWSGLVTGAATDDPRFVGPNAVREWRALQGLGDVPLENCLASNGHPIPGCTDATRLVHWRESVFGTELMTGWLGPGDNPVSRITIAAMQDMGYRVDYGEADAYALPGALPAASPAGGRWDAFVFIEPKGTLPSGVPAPSR